MGMNETPSANRLHIGFFGRRNAGKSSLLNAVTGQNLAIVSEIKGTTTDPVSKAMELLPFGPVVMTDTAGMDEEGDLGAMRKEKTLGVLHKTDLAILVIDGKCPPDSNEFEILERPLLTQFHKKRIPYLIAVNKSENLNPDEKNRVDQLLQNEESVLFLSAKSGENIQKLKETLASLVSSKETEKKIISDKLEKNDVVVLVVPIDSSAPKGRLILPQQQVIRDCLEGGAIPVVAKDTELRAALSSLSVKPKLIITDSQAFSRVAKDTPDDIYLTSFSILFSRYKGNFNQQIEGAKAIKSLKDNDIVLISEGCTHHRQCGDIGSVKLPRWLNEHTKKNLSFEFTSGGDFPKELTKYALIVHCGGCTLNGREMKYRLECAKEQNVPITNYGMAIAYLKGILKRSLEFFLKDPQEGL